MRGLAGHYSRYDATDKGAAEMKQRAQNQRAENEGELFQGKTPDRITTRFNRRRPKRLALRTDPTRRSAAIDDSSVDCDLSCNRLNLRRRQAEVLANLQLHSINFRDES